MSISDNPPRLKSSIIASPHNANMPFQFHFSPPVALTPRSVSWTCHANPPCGGWTRTQPLTEFRPPSPARNVAHRDGHGLLLPDQDDQPLPARNAGVEQVPLQHGVMLREHRDNHS